MKICSKDFCSRAFQLHAKVLKELQEHNIVQLTENYRKSWGNYIIATTESVLISISIKDVFGLYLPQIIT